MGCQAIKLIVGLCNPGSQYQYTRHNAGAWLVQGVAAKFNSTLTSNLKFFGLHAKVNLQGFNLHLLLPTTYMNESGRAVAAIANYYKIAAAEILVVHDDLDLEVGQVRLKLGGGHGGHNGLRDLDKALATKQYHRLRLGISHPMDKDLVSNYVLSAPSKLEMEKINSAIDSATVVLDDILAGNFEAAKRYLHSNRG